MKSSMKYILLLLVSFLAAGNAYGQERILEGIVVDGTDKESVTGVIVTLSNAENKIIRHATTNSKGEFRISTTADLEGCTLNFAMMGYEKHTVPVSGITAPIRVELNPAVTNIKEIRIKAPDISLRNDTLIYDAGKYTAAQDQNIGDVLKRLPGVDVKDNGQIEYQGKPINKLYIEGNDLVGGKHGLATQNISPKDVKSVEVMENHQPIKSLKDIDYSENAAINLKLQDDAKGRWVGTAGIGVGVTPLLAQGSLFGMRIGKGWQGLQNIKANNTGTNLGREMSNFSFMDSFGAGSGNLSDYISIGTGSAPLADKRTRFNHSAMFSSNNSRKISDDYKLDIRLNYLAEKLEANNSRVSSYFFEDGTQLDIEDNNSMLSKNHTLNGEVAVEANTDKYYLRNRLSADMEWKDTELAVTGTTPNDQFAKLPSTKIANNFSLVKRTGKNAFTISSLNQFISKPHSLSVERVGARQHQTATASAFYSNTSISYSYGWRKWQLSARAGFTANLRRLESELTGLESEKFPLENNSSMNYLQWYVLPAITYRSGSFRATLNIPLNYYNYRFNDRLGGGLVTDNDFITAPSLSLNYRISSKWTLYASGNIRKQPVDESNFYTGLIMANFRSLNAGIVDFGNSSAKSVSAGFEYKNPINSWFFNGNVTRSRNTSIYTVSEDFIGGGEYIVNTLVPQANDMDVWSARGSVSKGLDRIKGLLALDVNYSDVTSSMIRDGVLIPFTSRTLSLAPRLNGLIFKWLSAEYKLSFSRSYMDGAGGNSHTDGYTQSLSLHFYPTKKLNFSISGEHYYNQISPTRSKHFLFVDISAIYRIKSNWEISLSATNLLNEKEYSYMMLGELSSVRASYAIRPRNIILSTYIRF